MKEGLIKCGNGPHFVFKSALSIFLPLLSIPLVFHIPVKLRQCCIDITLHDHLLYTRVFSNVEGAREGRETPCEWPINDHLCQLQAADRAGEILLVIASDHGNVGECDALDCSLMAANKPGKFARVRTSASKLELTEKWYACTHPEILIQGSLIDHGQSARKPSFSRWPRFSNIERDK